MRLSRLFVSFGIVFALALTATSFAQEGAGRGQGRRGGQGRTARGFGGFGGFGGAMGKTALLGSDQVRGELKVTEEQAKKIDEILASYRETRREMFPRQRNTDLTPEERAKQREEATKKMAALTTKTDKQLVASLNEKQNKRLNQIILQQQGTRGLTSDFAIAALKLEKEQVEKIKGIIKKGDDDLQELMASMRGQFGRGRGGQGGGQGGGEDARSRFQEMREKMTALREKTDKDVLAVLTEDQAKALEAAKGEKFELDRRSMFRGRGRGAENGGGRGGRGPGGEGGGGQRRRPPVDDA